jgi:hypothetical protein
MKENEKETVTLDLDLDIEVLEGREELLVAAAGTCTSNHRGPKVAIVAITD